MFKTAGVARHARAWIETPQKIRFLYNTVVARHARAWIETMNLQGTGSEQESPATRGRGLKRCWDWDGCDLAVARHARAWIETV